MYKIEMLVFDNGERYPILMGSDGMPHFLATLWVTNNLRNSLAVNTISNYLRALKWFLQWEQNERRDLFSEFQQGKFLSDLDIDNIKKHCSLDIAHIRGLSKNKKSRGKVINIHNTPQLISITPTVGSNNIYIRLTSIAGYLDFIAKIAAQESNNKMLSTARECMKKSILDSRPSGKKNDDTSSVDSKTLPDGLIDDFMAVAHFDHPKNPFKHIATRKRNHLMFVLLKDLGIRRGELLSLSLESSNLMLHGTEKYIWVKRHHDDKFDHRRIQPVAKTKERMLRINDETAYLIDDYIINIRAKTPNANKHPYLFVTHRKGSTQGKPISISTFDTNIVSAMKGVDERFNAIHPHYFRHNWNTWFSGVIDKNNELAKQPNSKHTWIGEGDEAKMRMSHMGHSSERSATPYIKRHIRERANQLVLAEQEDLKRQLDESQHHKEDQ
ncbi:site-specific recombinase XerD [Aeromonas veronii]|uniref:site-specific integrase n=1 Tax=Aeromonas veronii TaxID=654 RepID=UPI001614B8E2|nr:site-specific integrase [Aeromonas veronii]MCS3834514.1 site-specific recombinase XerD [Aeromonas veronii]